jgi:hypothetical protein
VDVQAAIGQRPAKRLTKRPRIAEQPLEPVEIGEERFLGRPGHARRILLRDVEQRGLRRPIR